MQNDFMKLATFSIPSGFRGRSSFYVQLWWLVQSTFFAWSPQFMYGWRRFLLRAFGAKIGKNVIIRPTVKIPYPWKLSIGDYSWVGDDVTLYTLGEIEVGSNSVISQKSYLCAASHNYDKPNFLIWSKKITVEDECWLATDVYIAPGVTVGKGAVIGARSSVFSNMPEGMICFGNPAKPIKKRLD
ncbi:putative colanic acid biosynthesis acetyltransferase [Neptuniibacter sp. QD57_21]|uniref:putative colanic acid biosynthesis acetyltransferase n=1 Tax=Neptuniibacter sp. QD57_21 TaxID=3398213 RepID=UPI0039F615DE